MSVLNSISVLHGLEHAAWTCTVHIRFIFASLYSRQIVFISLLFVSYHIRFASIRFFSYSFRMPNFRIRFETNISESNLSIRYFAKIYSLPDSLRSEYERTPYVPRMPYARAGQNTL
jgi:hypothetical protein